MVRWLAAAWLGCATPLELEADHGSAGRSTVVEPPVEVEGWTLSDIEGVSFTSTNLIGRPTLVAVGGSRSPATGLVLPVLRGVSERRPGVQVVLIAVDPQDDPATLALYLGARAPAVRGLLGAPAALHQAMSSMRTSFAPSTTEPGALDHSTSLVVIDESARVRGYLHRPSDPVQVIVDLDRLLSDR